MAALWDTLYDIPSNNCEDVMKPTTSKKATDECSRLCYTRYTPVRLVINFYCILLSALIIVEFFFNFKL